MQPTPPRRPLGIVLLPAVLSLVIAAGTAIALHNPTSLWIGLLAPLMLLLPVIDRVVERRHTVVQKRRKLIQLRHQHPSVVELLAMGRLRVPVWALRGDRTARSAEQYLIRLGVHTGGLPVLVDPRGGIDVVGADARAHGCASAARAAIDWCFEPGAEQPVVTERDSGARWLVFVRPEGVASLVDRLGCEPRISAFTPDTLTDSQVASFGHRLATYCAREVLTTLDWDLVRDGPHALVSGVTGSGKTVFLTRWIGHLLESTSSADIVIGVIDHKGGGDFSAWQGVRGVAHIASSSQPESIRLAVAGLAALMARRAALLQTHACASIADLDERLRPARAVIVVDEYRALLDDHPSAQETLIDVAARGRALGVHLILATQRFAGVTGDALTSNCGIRVVFRAGDAQESMQLLGDTRANDPTLAPGEGFVLVPGQSVRRFQFDASSQYVGVADAVEGQAGGTFPSERLWLEPLERHSAWSEITETGTSGVVAGIADNLHGATRFAVCLPAQARLVLIVGGNHSSRRNMLTVVTQQCKIRFLESNGVSIWDELSTYPSRFPGGVSEADVREGELPMAWREPFADLLVDGVRRRVSAGRPVVISFTRPGPLVTRLREMDHLLIELDERDPNQARLGNQTFRPCVPAMVEGVADSPSEVASGESHDLTVQPHELVNALLVTPFVDTWLTKAGRGLTVCAPEDIVFGRVIRSHFTRHFVEGCSPSEARSLRWSDQAVPPPRPGTLCELQANGSWLRVEFSARTESAVATESQ